MASLAITFGSGAMTNSIADTTKTDLFMMIGSNPDTSHPTIGLRIHQALDRGARMIVIDPRKTAFAERADLWLQIQPGTDVALLNSMMQVILKEELWDRKYVEERTEDYDELVKVVEKYPPEEVAGICGIDAELIRRAARMYAAPGRHATFHGMGITHYATGTDRVKSIANLAMLCGKVGMEGGGCNPLRGQNNVQGACDMGALFNTLPGYGGLNNDELFDQYEKIWKVRLPRRPGKPATEVWENILKGDIRALYVFGEDPALADTNIGHVQEALKEVNFLVVQDIYLTDTAKMADVVLPAACFAEKDGTFTNTERRVQRVRKAVEPPGEAKPDWWVFCELASRMGYEMRYDSAEEIFAEIRQLLPQYKGINYSRLDQVGLQWPVPSEDHPGTPVLHVDKFTRGRGLFVPENYIPPQEPVDGDYPMLFTTIREYARYNFSSMTGKTPEIDDIAPEAWAEVHPADAERMGIKERDLLCLTSRRGSVDIRARITDRTQEGTISAPYNFAETPVNYLTLDALDRLSRTPEYKLCAIRVEVLDHD